MDDKDEVRIKFLGVLNEFEKEAKEIINEINSSEKGILDLNFLKENPQFLSGFLKKAFVQGYEKPCALYLNENFDFFELIISRNKKLIEICNEYEEIINEEDEMLGDFYKKIEDLSLKIKVDISLEKLYLFLNELFENSDQLKSLITSCQDMDLLIFLFNRYVNNNDISEDIIMLFSEKIDLQYILLSYAVNNEKVYKYFKITDTDLEIIMETVNSNPEYNKYVIDGIEYINNLNSFLDNKKFVNFLFTNSYNKILFYLSDEQINNNYDTIKHFLDGNNYLSSSNKELINKRLLKSNVLFDLMFNKIKSDEENLTLIALLSEDYNDSIRITKCLLQSDSIIEINGVKKDDDNWLNNIELAIKSGYKCSNLTKIRNQEELNIFIQNKQYEIIDYVDKKLLNLENVLFAMDNGYVIDHKYENEVLNKYIEKHKNTKLVNYLVAFLYLLPGYADRFTSNEIINKYFSNDGPTELLYEKSLLNVSIFKVLFLSDKYFNDYINRFNPPDYIKHYINLYRNNDMVNSGFIFSDYIKEFNDINKYFTNNGPNKDLFEIILFDKQMYRRYYLLTKNKYLIDYINNYFPSIFSYMNFKKEISNINFLELKSVDDINIYFEKEGPKQPIYEMALFNFELFNAIFKNDKYLNDYITRFNPSENIKAYIDFTRDVGFVDFIDSNNLNQWFKDGKFSKELYEKSLFDSKLYNKIFNRNEYLDDYITRFNPSEEIKQYIKFIKANRFIFSNLIREPEEIGTYFDENGPKQKLYEKALLDSNLFDAFFKNDNLYNDYITRFNPSDAIKSYIQFIKDNGFILEELIKKPTDIEIYFDKDGINEFGTYTIHKDTSIYENLDKNYFKNFYVDNFNYSEILDSILTKLDNNYSYFMDFLINTLNLSYPIEEVKEDEIKKVYCLQTIDENKLIEIIKYAYFGTIDKNILKSMSINNELSLCINLYLKSCPKWNIDDFIKFISNYEENKELCNNLINEEELTNDEKLKLQMILINGFRSAFGVIKTKDDLANFNTLIVENNNNIIKSNNTNDIKKLIFNYLFNISLDEVQIIKGKYEKNVDDLGKDESNKGLKKLQSSLNNPELKEIIDEYDTIIKFILDIEKSNDLDGLKQMANILNGLIYSGQLNKLYELWNFYSKLDSDIMTICGEEINEKIINYDELLNTPEDNIPLIENEKSFFVKNISVPNDFEYDEKKIKVGANVKMIELNGLPFVAFGHVLNAIGSGGKLSDYNHPRVIGRTHLCLSAIDDNYYSLVERHDRGIDYVQLLFNDLSADQLAISSHRDVYSHTQNNSKNITAGYKGTYLPIRETITNTYHGENGYNEYVYYREGLKPSGILIRGNEPTESEIQAAAYLSRICGKDIPLIKINKEKYPIRTKEEMQKRDEELKDYYKELYETRKRSQRMQEIEKMKQMRDYLMKLKLLGDFGEQLEGEQNERRK